MVVKPNVATNARTSANLRKNPNSTMPLTLHIVASCEKIDEQQHKNTGNISHISIEQYSCKSFPFRRLKMIIIIHMNIHTSCAAASARKSASGSSVTRRQSLNLTDGTTTSLMTLLNAVRGTPKTQSRARLHASGKSVAPYLFCFV